MRDGNAINTVNTVNTIPAAADASTNRTEIVGTPTNDGQPPQEAITACEGLSQGLSCQFTAPHGQINGACQQVQAQLTCVPTGGPPPGR